MGEEEKKTEEKSKGKEEKSAAAEEKKDPGAGGDGEKKEGGGEEKAAAAPPPPPEEIVMRVYMHCEGCARKVKRSLKGFDGVEEVSTDSKAHRVVVKGKKAAEDPMRVVERVQKKTGRKVELLTPLPPPPPKPEETKKQELEKKDEEKPKPDEKKEPTIVTVVLKVHMHCEACAQEIKKRILKMKGVQSAEPDLKASEVTVKGIFDPPSKLVEYVYKRTGKHAAIIKTDPPMEPPPADGEKPKDDKKEEKKAEEKKAEEKKDEKKKEETAAGEEKKDGDGSPEESGGGAGSMAAAAKVERMLNELYQHYPRHTVGYAAGYPYHQYPPQIFSDENPNACSVM